MNSLSYSANALQVLSSFHRKLVVYVEGPDDVPFWNSTLSLYGLRDYIVEPAGGVLNIQKYVQAIIDNDVNIIVAMDCDYSDLLNTQCRHPKVLYTYGYSIENTLYSPRCIANAITILARSNEDVETEVSHWLKKFVEAFRSLIALDIASALFDKRLEVLGNNCARYLKSQRSTEPSLEKIQSALSHLREHFGKSEIEEVEKLLDETRKELQHVIRGHFLTHAIGNFILCKTRELGGHVRVMPHDLLYGVMVAQLERSIDGMDLKHLRLQIERLCQVYERRS